MAKFGPKNALNFFSKSNPSPFWMATLAYLGHCVHVLTCLDPPKIPTFALFGASAASKDTPDWFRNEPKTRLFQLKYILIKIKTILDHWWVIGDQTHFEPLLRPFRIVLMPRGSELPFQAPKGIKTGSKMWFLHIGPWVTWNAGKRAIMHPRMHACNMEERCRIKDS